MGSLLTNLQDDHHAAPYVRKATHAGSWYSGSGRQLGEQLEGWLQVALKEKKDTTSQSKNLARAIIAPHAGYSYSGPTAAYAYMNVDVTNIRRIFILGPSHHVYIRACAISGASSCETPVGNLKVDDTVRAELLQNDLFQLMSQGVDEDEHSIELHLPYIAQLVGTRDIPIVPIMVGSIDADLEAEYGKLLAPYLEDPCNFFVISSDFCHWGNRFRYQPYDGSQGWETIADYIEWLDHEGMRLIEEGDPQAFTAYLRKYQNTICGRHPISVFLNAAKVYSSNRKEGKNGGSSSSTKVSASSLSVRFVRYAQSSRCKKKQDSSVSYASAVAEEN